MGQFEISGSRNSFRFFLYSVNSVVSRKDLSTEYTENTDKYTEKLGNFKLTHYPSQLPGYGFIPKMQCARVLMGFHKLCHRNARAVVDVFDPHLVHQPTHKVDAPAAAALVFRGFEIRFIRQPQTSV